MSRNLLSHLAVLFFFVFFYLACEPEAPPCTDEANPECPNYNPCLDAKKANAGFLILDSISPSVGVYEVAFPVDTYWVPNNNIYFRALHPNDTYEWKVGTDARVFTQKEFTLAFWQDAIGDIPVRLITTRKPRPECFPGDDGRDTFKRNLYLYDYDKIYTKIPIVGKYRGYDEHRKDSIFTIEVTLDQSGFASILNFPRECTKSTDVPTRPTLSWDAFHIDEEDGCGFADGIGRLQPDRKTLIIEYTVWSGWTASPRIKRRFVGTKL